jgi:hypothetical protein
MANVAMALRRRARERIDAPRHSEAATEFAARISSMHQWM